MLARILRVDLSRGVVSEETCPEKYELLGGRGLTSGLLADEVDPRCEPLGPANKLIFAPGLLGGTVVPNSGRLSVGAKSPLTGGIKEANAGGVAAQMLARHGIKALVVEGACPGGPKYLQVNDEGVFLRDFDGDAYAGNYAVHERLRGRHGAEIGILSAGPAGMRQLLCAGIAVSDPEGRPTRYAGRGGLGAVMGAKGLKAIVIEPSARRPEDKPSERLRSAARAFAESITANPGVQHMHAYGTAGTIDLACELGSLPTESFRKGKFEGAKNINGATLVALQKQRGGRTGHRCMPGCVVACSNIFFNERGEHVTSALEYETLCLLGSNLRIDDIDAIARLDRACDDTGIDTIELGATVGVAMDEGRIPYGDSARVLELIGEVGRGTDTGRLYGNGVVHLARALGAKRVPATLGQGHPAHDPRTLNGVGVTYATSPMGADHTAGLPFSPNKKKAVALSKESQITSMLCDVLGICIFVFATVDALAGVYGAFCNRDVSADEMRSWALSLLRAEVAFNERAGVPPAQERVGRIFREEPLPETGNLFDTSFEEMEGIFQG